MKLYTNLHTILPAHQDAVLAIGNFDGVHTGHRALLAQAQKTAGLQKKPFGILTFEPHPRSLFRPDDPPFRITPTDMKTTQLADCGADFCVVLNFTWDMASLPAEEFVQDILINRLKAGHIMIGFDFKFGQMRKGSAETIEALGLPVTSFDAVENEAGVKISSSAIRQNLRQGHVEEANAMLGRSWEMRGVIQKGDRRGHELGYPTANFNLGETLHPAYGVYAALAQIEGETDWHKAAVNIGIRPMFELREGRVEAHLLDFPERNIYDKTLTVRPVQRLRSEAKFDSLDALVAQMGQDCAQTRDILSKT